MHICAMAHIRKYVFSLTHHKNLFDLFGPPKTSKHILRIMKYILPIRAPKITNNLLKLSTANLM